MNNQTTSLSQLTAANKAAAVDFLTMVVDGQVEEAYKKYVDEFGRHHNVYFAAGFPALRRAMLEAHQQFPNKVFSMKHVLADGNLVAAHSSMTLRPGEPAIAVVHLFRFAAGRIIEMWDVGTTLPADSPNKDGAF